jgi:hypothetical protein
MKLLNKLRKQKTKKDFLANMEEYLLKKDIVESCVSALSFTKPELEEEVVEHLFLTSLVAFVPVETLEGIRNELTTEADKKVKEVVGMYESFNMESNHE